MRHVSANILCLIVMLGAVIPVLQNSFPSARADGSGCSGPSPGQVMFLPFFTAWENYQKVGTAQPGCVGHQVYSSNNFAGPTGSGTPYLDVVSNSIISAPWPISNGEGTSSYALRATGWFSGSNSWGLLKLFDNSLGDEAVHFQLKPHTYFSVWYDHNGAEADKYVMLDALLYNAATHKYALLGDFYTTDSHGNRQYVVDQNNSRLNAAYRFNDKTNIWLHSVFSLDLVYRDSPSWYVVAIYVRFDNSNTYGQVTGRTLTYFDNLRIIYSVTQDSTWVYPGWKNSSNSLGPFDVITSAVAWASYPTGSSGNYGLDLQVSVLGYSDASAYASQAQNYQVAYPDNITITVGNSLPPGSVGFEQQGDSNWQPATAFNLTQEQTGFYGRYADYLFDVSMAILSGAVPPLSGIITVGTLAAQYLQLTSGQPPQNVAFFYSWPLATYYAMTHFLYSSSWAVAANDAAGEAVLSASGIAANTTVNIPITGAVIYAYNIVNDPDPAFRQLLPQFSSTLHLLFTAGADPMPSQSSSPCSLSAAAGGSSTSSTIAASFCDGGSTSVSLILTSNSIQNNTVTVANTSSSPLTPSYLYLSFSPRPTTLPINGSTSFNVVFSIPSNIKIYSTVTYNVVITANSTIAPPSSVTIALTVQKNCYGSGCICSHFSTTLKPNSGSASSPYVTDLTSNLTVIWTRGERAIPVTITVQAPNQLQQYFTYSVTKIAQPAENVVVYQLTFNIARGARQGVYPLTVTVQEIGTQDQVYKTAIYMLTVSE